ESVVGQIRHPGRVDRKIPDLVLLVVVASIDAPTAPIGKAIEVALALTAQDQPGGFALIAPPVAAFVDQGDLGTLETNGAWNELQIVFPTDQPYGRLVLIPREDDCPIAEDRLAGRVVHAHEEDTVVLELKTVPRHE